MPPDASDAPEERPGVAALPSGDGGRTEGIVLIMRLMDVTTHTSPSASSPQFSQEKALAACAALLKNMNMVFKSKINGSLGLGS